MTPELAPGLWALSVFALMPVALLLLAIVDRLRPEWMGYVAYGYIALCGVLLIVSIALTY